MTGSSSSSFPPTPASLSSDPALLEFVDAHLKPSRIFSEIASHSSLLAFGEKLELPSNQRVKCNGQVYKLTNAIQKIVQVARFYVSGSYGRRVTVGTIETDLVAFLRNPDMLPPYTKSNESLLVKLRAALEKVFEDDKEVELFPLVNPECFLGDAKRSRVCHKKEDPNHRCCEDFISVRIEDANFRIFLAPALGQSTEEQRQATYKKMQEAYLRRRRHPRGVERALGCWGAALVEKPSEEMAHAAVEEHAFIRVCQYWVRANGIESLQRYAVEALALLVARKSSREPHVPTSSSHSERSYSSRSDDSLKSKFDLLAAFRRFLSYCADLKSVRHLIEIESPATYVSPFTDTPADVPILLDRFNPYCNLLESLTREDQQLLCISATHTLNLLKSASTINKKNFGPKLAEVFAAAPRCGVAEKLKGFFRFILWIIFVFIVCMGVYVAILWGRSNSDKTDVFEIIKNDMQWLHQVLRVWQRAGDQWYHSLHQFIIERLRGSDNGDSSTYNGSNDRSRGDL